MEELAAVVARNVTQLRGKRTMDAIAGNARKLGGRWDSGSVAKIERGQYKPTIQHLVLLAASLDCSVSDLLESSDRIAITTVFSLTGDELIDAISRSGQIPGVERFAADLRAAYADAPEDMRRALKDSPAGALAPAVHVYQSMHDGDERIARSLGLNLTVFAQWCARLWGRSFVTERDARAGGEQSSPQKRGRVTRELKAELQKAMRDGND